MGGGGGGGGGLFWHIQEVLQLKSGSHPLWKLFIYGSSDRAHTLSSPTADILHQNSA